MCNLRNGHPVSIFNFILHFIHLYYYVFLLYYYSERVYEFVWRLECIRIVFDFSVCLNRGCPLVGILKPQKQMQLILHSHISTNASGRIIITYKNHSAIMHHGHGSILSMGDHINYYYVRNQVTFIAFKLCIIYSFHVN